MIRKQLQLDCFQWWFEFPIDNAAKTIIYGSIHNPIIEFEWFHKTRILLFIKWIRVFILPRDQLLTHFFSGHIISIIFIHNSRHFRKLFSGLLSCDTLHGRWFDCISSRPLTTRYVPCGERTGANHSLLNLSWFRRRFLYSYLKGEKNVVHLFLHRMAGWQSSAWTLKMHSLFGTIIYEHKKTWWMK